MSKEISTPKSVRFSEDKMNYILRNIPENRRSENGVFSPELMKIIDEHEEITVKKPEKIKMLDKEIAEKEERLKKVTDLLRKSNEIKNAVDNQVKSIESFCIRIHQAL